MSLDEICEYYVLKPCITTAPLQRTQSLSANSREDRYSIALTAKVSQSAG